MRRRVRRRGASGRDGREHLTRIHPTREHVLSRRQAARWRGPAQRHRVARYLARIQVGWRLQGRRQVGGCHEHATAMRDGHQVGAHEEQFIHGRVGRAVVRQRPGRAAILAGEDAHFRAGVDPVAVGRVHLEIAHRHVRQRRRAATRARDVRPAGTAIHALVDVVARETAQRRVDDVVVRRVHGQARDAAVWQPVGRAVVVDGDPAREQRGRGGIAGDRLVDAARVVADVDDVGVPGATAMALILSLSPSEFLTTSHEGVAALTLLLRHSCCAAPRSRFELFGSRAKAAMNSVAALDPASVIPL